MPYEVPQSKKSLKQNVFEFTFPRSKKVYSVPLVKYIRPGLAIEIGELGEVEMVKRLFEEFAPGQNLLDKFEDMEQLEAWAHAWREASGISVGESQASAES